MSAMDFIQACLAVCGGVSIVGGASTVVYRWLNPAIKLSARVKKLEDYSEKDYERLKAIEDIQKLQNKSLAAMLNHQIDGNGVESMKQIRDELLDSLIEK